MKGVWKRKWMVIPVAVAALLAAGAVGAVALATPGSGDPGRDSGEIVAAATVAATTDTTVAQVAPAAKELGKRKAHIQERRERIKDRLERFKDRWVDARSRMTAEDQAAFDQLQDKAEGQREALRQAREDLAETLKQMRELARKYPPANTTTTAAPAN